MAFCIYIYRILRHILYMVSNNGRFAQNKSKKVLAIVSKVRYNGES